MGLGSDPADDEVLTIVIQDSEMLNRLAAHRFAVQSLNEELSVVEDHLEDILQLLEKELGIGDST
jgi:hypothetical protein